MKFGIRTKLPFNKTFPRKIVSRRNKKRQIFMNKQVHLSLSKLEIS